MIKYTLMHTNSGKYMNTGWKFNVNDISKAYFYEEEAVAKEIKQMIYVGMEQEITVVKVVFEVKEIVVV